MYLNKFNEFKKYFYYLCTIFDLNILYTGLFSSQLRNKYNNIINKEEIKDTKINKRI